MQQIDAGEYDDAIATLREAKKLTSTKKNLIDYEIAFAYYLKKDYSTAISTLEKLIAKDKTNFQFYQLLGNAYDMDGRANKAVTIYEEGMNLFPGVGNFYLEKGVVLLAREEYNEGVKVFEQGIQADPNYPSNYYHLSKLYYGSEEEIWGLLYGEIFMNLERNSKRTQEISKNLYDLYKKSIVIENDTSVSLSMTKRQIIVNADNMKDMDNIMPFENEYEMSFVGAVFMKNTYPLKDLVEVRKSFLEYWNKKKKRHRNALIDYQNKVNKAGHFEAYSYWLLMQANTEQYDAWYNANKNQYDAFVKWFLKNPMNLKKGDKYYREQYQ